MRLRLLRRVPGGRRLAARIARNNMQRDLPMKKADFTSAFFI
jgi:hypothetical protein